MPDTTPMLEQHEPRSIDQVMRDMQLPMLRALMTRTRLEWRSRYSAFRQFQIENSIRRPSWRVEMETQAWKDARKAVRRYGMLREMSAEIRKMQG